MADMVEKEHLSVIRPDFGTKPRVFYKNLDDALSHLVAGNVCEDLGGGRLRNLEGAEVCPARLLRWKRTRNQDRPFRRLPILWVDCAVIAHRVAGEKGRNGKGPRYERPGDLEASTSARYSFDTKVSRVSAKQR